MMRGVSSKAGSHSAG